MSDVVPLPVKRPADDSVERYSRLTWHLRAMGYDFPSIPPALHKLREAQAEKR